ncbi:hypothetical protein A2U01_0039433, partial [Trifolium medium]|nr:hypothetical protein [Trifolium medium]
VCGGVKQVEEESDDNRETVQWVVQDDGGDAVRRRRFG